MNARQGERVRSLVMEISTNNSIGGAVWTGALLQDAAGGYWMGVHTTNGVEHWNSEVAALDATNLEDAQAEVRIKLNALIRACMGAGAP